MTSPSSRLYLGMIERDGAGGWMGDVPEVPGCRVRASTLRETRQRLREHLAVMVGADEKPWLVDGVRLPGVPSEPLPRRRRTRKAAEARRRDAEAAYAEYGQEIGVSGPRLLELERQILRRLERLSQGGE